MKIQSITSMHFFLFLIIKWKGKKGIFVILNKGWKNVIKIGVKFYESIENWHGNVNM